MSRYRPSCSWLSSWLCSFQCCRENKETKATDSSILCCGLRGPAHFRESQGHSLCLPFLLSQDNLCFNILYCFWSIRSFISYNYTDSSHQEQKSKEVVGKLCHKGMDLPPQTTDILLLRAGHLVTRPSPRVWDPECSCLEFRWVPVSLSSFCHLLMVILEALDTSDFSLSLASSLLQPLRLPSGHQDY